MKNAAEKVVIHWLDEVDSTNAAVLRTMPDLDNLSVVAARSQTAGRGQKGNRWLSTPGENLTFTVCVKERLFDVPLIRLNELAALSVRDYLRARGIPAVIKWPNDIYVGVRKICGILVENRLTPDEVHSAVGIGLNMNQTVFPVELVNPTSMKRLTGRSFDPAEELKALMEVFLFQYGRDFEALHADFCEGLFQQGVPCPYRDLGNGNIFTGTILGVEKDGRLQVVSEGTVRLYGFKDIGYIL